MLWRLCGSEESSVDFAFSNRRSTGEGLFVLARILAAPPSLTNGFLFETQEEFYRTLAGSNGLEIAAKRLASHIGLRSLPSVEFCDNKTMFTAGSASGHNIRIATHYKERPAALAAVLAHEMSHVFLTEQGVHQDDSRINYPYFRLDHGGWGESYEFLTDLCAIYLGLGKVYLNGKESLREDGGALILGYLSLADLAHAYELVNSLMEIPPSVCTANLSIRAMAYVRSFIATRAEAWKSVERDLEKLRAQLRLCARMLEKARGLHAKIAAQRLDQLASLSVEDDAGRRPSFRGPLPHACMRRYSVSAAGA